MNFTPDFSGRTVLVTGAAQGIGRGVAAYFVGAGAAVAAVDLDERALEDTWGASPAVLCLPADVSDRNAVDQVVNAVVDRFGTLDVLVNNAGITRDRMVWKLSDDDWDSVMGVHVTGTFNFIRAAVPIMRKAQRGRIINVTSYSGIRGNIGQANYAAAKAAVMGLTRTVAKEVAGFGITVNAISPNALTRMVEAVPEETRRRLEAEIPVGRFADPDEIAPAFAFLASDEAGYITGTVLPVDGGISI